MPLMNPPSVMAIQPELVSGETVLWADQPNTRVNFHKEDLFIVPFSLLWGGFAIFWELMASGVWGSNKPSNGPWLFGMVFGMAFVLLGQYMIWGRFLYARWKKQRIHYAVTNRRVIAICQGAKLQVATSFVDVLPTIIKEIGRNGIGTLRFSQPQSSMSGGMYNWDPLAFGTTPTFLDIEDVESVYRLVSDLREQSRAPTKTF